MVERRIQIGTGHGRGVWPVLVVLLLAVLVPTACVLWFMNAAMRNERLAVRQKLTDAYREHAADARESLERYWSAKTDALENARPLGPPQAFATLVRSGVAEGVIVCGEGGEPEYPDTPQPPSREEGEDSPQWRNPRELEYDLNEPGKAAEEYAGLAREAGDVNRQAQALRAQARCLAKSDRKQDAIKILIEPLTGAELRGAVDARGRLIAPSALLFALQLLESPTDGVARRVADQLAERLNDYGDPAMPSTQRRFLMRMLQEIDPKAPALATLAGEDLSAQYLENPQPTVEALHLRKASPPGVWHVGSKDRRIVALFSEKKLIAEMSSAANLAEPFAGATFRLSPPDPSGVKQDAFLSAPGCRQLPGWELQVHIVGESPFAAAADRQRAAYLWTGALGIAVIVALALIVTHHLGRQMRLTRLKNDLIATVSHELKTPLSSMRVLVDTLLDGRCRDQQQAHEYFQLIARENARLTRLIDNFLTFSRMERNKKAFELAPLRVEEIVSAAVDSVKDRFTRPGCRLDVDIAPNLPPIVGDRDALITVILNLLDNAYKYSGDGKRIAIRARADGGGICLEVTDNGVGLSRRAIRRIFDRFYQVDRSLSRGIGGCGLGLSIVKFIVDAHGGSIRVTSQVGEGSTFTVELPLPGATARSKREND